MGAAEEAKQNVRAVYLLSLAEGVMITARPPAKKNN
jgi:hypothetical protein